MKDETSRIPLVEDQPVIDFRWRRAENYHDRIEYHYVTLRPLLLWACAACLPVLVILICFELYWGVLIATAAFITTVVTVRLMFVRGLPVIDRAQNKVRIGGVVLEFEQILALQMLQSGDFWELNMVQIDGGRTNLFIHSSKDFLLAEAKVLSAELKVPIWFSLEEKDEKELPPLTRDSIEWAPSQEAVFIDWLSEYEKSIDEAGRIYYRRRKFRWSKLGDSLLLPGGGLWLNVIIIPVILISSLMTLLAERFSEYVFDPATGLINMGKYRPQISFDDVYALQLIINNEHETVMNLVLKNGNRIPFLCDTKHDYAMEEAKNIGELLKVPILSR